MSDLTFDVEKHEYRVDGRRVDSVTTILGEWQEVKVGGERYHINTHSGSVIPSRRMEEAQDFGTAVHLGCNFILQYGSVDYLTLDPALAPCLGQFERWLLDYDVKPILFESPMYSKRFDYSGTPDLICVLNGNLLSVCDYKTTPLYPMAGPQTAAYEQLYRENHKDFRVMERYVLHLPKDGGDYELHQVGRVQDFAYFKAKLYTHQYFGVK